MFNFLSSIYAAGVKLQSSLLILKHKLLMAAVGGPTVDSVLKSGQSAMEDGGSLSELSGKVDEFGGGAYHITYKIVVYVILIVLMVSGLALAISNASTRGEKKANVGYVVLGAILAFAAGSIIVFLETVGKGLF